MDHFLKSFKILAVFTLLTGFIYPLLVTGIVQVLFPYQANGSLVHKGNAVIGSELIGQKFDSSVYFSSRPSAVDFNPMPSGATNLGPGNSRLRELTAAVRADFVKRNNAGTDSKLPSEMFFSSASGLDPHISPQAAFIQASRVASERHFSDEQRDKLIQLIKNQTEKPQLMFMGESRINVLLLNLCADTIK
jgi:K+-transporting ATPase ATPase C chain